MTPSDRAEVVSARLLFDGMDDQAVGQFLQSETDHLLMAFVGGQAAGFLIAHELRRLDGLSAEMFLYEIGTDQQFQRRGVGRALVTALKALAKARGCRGLFVATNASNGAAMGLYEITGALRAAQDDVILEYKL